MSHLKIRIILAFASVYVIWGSTYLAIRYTIETLPPFWSAGIRFLVAGVIFILYAAWKGQRTTDWQHWKSAIIIGGLLLLGGNGSVVWAEQYIPSGLASLMIATTPIWMVLIDAVFIKKTRPKVGILAGIFLGFLGVSLLMSSQFYQPVVVNPVGLFVLLLAALSWAIGSVYSRQASLPKFPILAIGMEMFCGGILLCLAGCFTGETFNWEQASLRSVLGFLYLIFFGSLIGFASYIWLLQKVAIEKVATYAYVNPIVAVFLGWALEKEILSSGTMIAAILVILSVVLITLNPDKKHSIV